MESLSVIIPVYNCMNYLEKCVDSVAAVNSLCKTGLIQEVILVDDGSTDGSSEICDQMVMNRPGNCPIRVIHQVNRGVSAARNIGLCAATGDFVLFMDSDDTVDAEKLARLIQEVTSDAAIDMAVFGTSFDYYAGQRIFRQDIKLPPVEGLRTPDECRVELFSLFKTNMISPLWNKLIRRRVIEDVGLSLREDMFLYEDLEFSLRVMAHCDTFLFCAEPIYHYRQSSDEGNAGRRLKRIEHIPEIVDKIEEALTPFGGNDQILLSLYLVLAREKIICATRDEVKAVCDDFHIWIDTHDYLSMIQDREYAMLAYCGQSTKLLCRREITRIRHCLANWIKQRVGDFRKW